MKRILLAIALMLTASSAGASGGFDTGNSLQRYWDDCDKYRAGERTFDNYAACGMAHGFVVGVAGGYENAMVWGRTPRKLCMPAHVEQGQLTPIVRKYFKEHPELLHLPASSVVLIALQTAFPCE